MRKKLNHVSNLQYLHRIFDNKNKDGETALKVNDFIFRCINEDGPPLCVRNALGNSNPGFKHTSIRSACFEKLRGNPISQISMTAHMDFLATETSGIIQVEYKGNESFGKTISEVLNKEDNKLEKFSGIFDVKKKDIFDMPYNLLRRICCLEHKAVKVNADAILVVNSFSESGKHFKTFKSFSEAIGIPVDAPGILSEPKQMVSYTPEGILFPELGNLYLMWVKDEKYPGFDE